MRPRSHDKRQFGRAAHAMREVRISRAILLVLAALLLAPTLRVRAAPPAPIVVSLAQPDGTTFDATCIGDEWGSWYETVEGYTVVQDKRTAAWFYASVNSMGSLVPGRLSPGHEQPEGLSRHVRPVTLPTRPDVGASGGTRYASVRVNGSAAQPALVILLQFSDRASVGTTAAQWSSSFFGNVDSVADYYREVSYGQLTLVPAQERHGVAGDGVVGWLTLNRPHPDTGAETGNPNRQLARDAILAADPYIDYASFDADFNGYISSNELHITVIAAGYETSYGGSSASCTPGIWGHQWSLGGAYQGVIVDAPLVDGKVVAEYSEGGSYTEFGEQHCSNADSPGHMATIGIMVHEMGHELNWPDLYDTDLSSQGVGIWSVMGYGSWLKTDGYPGSVPAHPDAWSKWYQGWLTPHQVLTVETDVPLPEVEVHPGVLQLRDNPGGVDWAFNRHSGSGEYFLIENRQQKGYDAGLPGCGLLIWHIDETCTSGSSANAADSHRLVDLEEADGLGELDSNASPGDAGDPYPGLGGNTAFDDASSPDSRLYSGAGSDVSVARISAACADTMTADLSAQGSTPDISVAPAELHVGALVSQSVTRAVTIINVGTAPLTFTVSEESAPSASGQATPHPIERTGMARVLSGADVAWLSASPTSGMVAAGHSQGVTLTLDSTGLSTGTYGANLVITSNDPDDSLTFVRVTLHVSWQPQPELEVTPGALEVTVRPGQSTALALTLANPGSGSLTFTITDRETARPQPTVQALFSRPAPDETARLNGLGALDVLPSPAAYSVAGPPVAPRILVYSDDPRVGAGSTLVDHALQGLGLAYTGYYREPAAFAAALISSTWDAAIVSHELEYSLGNHWPELERYFSAGGRLVISTFDIDGSDSVSTTLWDTLGTRQVSELSGPAAVYPWDRGHPVWSGVPVLAAWDHIFADEGDRVTSSTGGTTVGGFTPVPTSGQGAVVVHAGGRAIVNSFVLDELRSDEDGDGVLDAIELWRNEIAYILAVGADARWLTETPMTGTLLPGAALTVTVAFSAMGLAEGTYSADLLIASTAFDRPVVTVPITFHVAPVPDVWHAYLPAIRRSAP